MTTSLRWRRRDFPPQCVVGVLVWAIAGNALASCSRAEESTPWKTIDGGTVTIPAPGALATVVVTIGHDCPISNAYAAELRRLHDRYAAKKIAFVLLYADFDLELEAAQRHAKDFELTFPAVFDPSLALAKKLEAKTKPQAIVVSPDGSAVYRGRIDNLYYDFGKRRPVATKRDLSEALDAILGGMAPEVAETKALGCPIHFPE